MYKIAFLLLTVSFAYGQEPLTVSTMKFSKNVKSVTINGDCNDNDTYYFDRDGFLTEHHLSGSDEANVYVILYQYENGKPVLIEYTTNSIVTQTETYEYEGGRIMRYTESGEDVEPVEVRYNYENGRLSSVLTDRDGDITREDYSYSNTATESRITTAFGLMGITVKYKDGNTITYEHYEGETSDAEVMRLETYDDNGNLIESFWPGDDGSEDESHFYEYEGKVLVHQQDFADSKLIGEVFYDSKGNMIRESNADSFIAYTNRYNERGDLIEVRQVSGNFEVLCTTKYTYEYWQ